MSKYYKPTLDDFILGLEYQVKDNTNDDADWETKTVTKSTFQVTNGASDIGQIAHDLYTKDAKNSYRVRVIGEDDFITRGFKKTTPVFLDNRLYNTYIGHGVQIIERQEDLTIKDGTNTTFEGTILNSAQLDVLLSQLDLESSSNYKLRRKLTTATHE